MRGIGWAIVVIGLLQSAVLERNHNVAIPTAVYTECPEGWPASAPWSVF